MNRKTKQTDNNNNTTYVKFCFTTKRRVSGQKYSLLLKKKSKDFKMFFIAFCLLNYLLPCCNMLAQPKGFTDDPYVNDEKFIEKGNSIHNG